LTISEVNFYIQKQLSELFISKIIFITPSLLECAIFVVPLFLNLKITFEIVSFEKK